MTFGHLITQARKAAGFTQGQVAQAIRVKRETLSRWERDMLTITPPADEMTRLCSVLPLTHYGLLTALGYNLASAQLQFPLTRQEQLLLSANRRLDPNTRDMLLRIAKAMYDDPAGQEQGA